VINKLGTELNSNRTKISLTYLPTQVASSVAHLKQKKILDIELIKMTHMEKSNTSNK
jgi:hypothetical protein